MLYFKAYKGQLAVIEQAIETASLMLGSQRARGYCLEMICADFLAGASLEEPNSSTLLDSIRRLLGLLPRQQKCELAEALRENRMNEFRPGRPRIRLAKGDYRRLCRRVLDRDRWRCQICGTASQLQVHHVQFRSSLGGDSIENLLTVCSPCHGELHDVY